MVFYTNEVAIPILMKLSRWLQWEKAEGSTHEMVGTWMKGISIHVRVDELGNDVIGVK